MSHKKILVIGCGPAGSTIARNFAEKNFHVDIFDSRDHIAGNCFDKINEHGHLIHVYGPHYFRTDSEELFQWLSTFTEWIPGKYYVKAKVLGKEVPLPISLATMDVIKNLKFKKEDFEDYLKNNIEKFPSITNAQEQCLSTVGKELYELLFKNYTIKQWGVHPCELESFVTARIPLRFDHDTRYPSEKFQFLPKNGYTEMFQKILNHPNIHLFLNSSISSNYIYKNKNKYFATFYTGPIDNFYNFCFGKLQYRSLNFVWRHFSNLDYYQSCVQYNYPNDYEFTRSVESKHITSINGKGTTVCFEYPTDTGDPYYPMPIKTQQEKYKRYSALAENEKNQDNPIYFLGRLAEYKYYNMDHIFLRAINLCKEILKGC